MSNHLVCESSGVVNFVIYYILIVNGGDSNVKRFVYNNYKGKEGVGVFVFILRWKE